MKVDWDRSFGGHSTLKVRDYLKRWGPDDLGVCTAEKFFGVGAMIEAAMLIDVLKDMEFIDRDPVTETFAGRSPNRPCLIHYNPPCDVPTFGLAAAGFGLANAKKLKRITRVKADAILADLIVEIRRINADPLMIDHITKLVVFGSYLGDMPDLGDIDVCVSVCRKAVGGQYDIAHKRFGDMFPAPAAHFGSIDRLLWPSLYVQRRLRRVSSLLSFYESFEALLALGCPFKVVFEDIHRSTSATGTGGSPADAIEAQPRWKPR